MPKVIIVEPNITREESDKNLEKIFRVMDEIAKEMRERGEV